MIFVCFPFCGKLATLDKYNVLSQYNTLNLRPNQYRCSHHMPHSMYAVIVKGWIPWYSLVHGTAMSGCLLSPLFSCKIIQSIYKMTFEMMHWEAKCVHCIQFGPAIWYSIQKGIKYLWNLFLKNWEISCTISFQVKTTFILFRE